MRALIVDDNDNDRKLLRINLERHGCATVIEARDGLEGLRKAKELKPDLIISDALMPRMDGFEFLREVKSDEALNAIPFVFHSSVYTGSRDEELASRLGAEAFITKPKAPEEFWEEIASILDRLASGAEKRPSFELMDEEREYLREYSSVVSAKLEEKVRELEESLKRREEAEEELLKLSAAVEQSPIAIVITDPGGIIEYVNPKFTQMTGYGPQEVTGKTPRIMKSGETTALEYKRLWDTITSGDVWQGEFHNRKKNGELIWEYATISPVKNKNGLITHFIAIKEDISERKKLEDQLRHAQKMEAVGTLAGGIAHDFNNILTVIIGFGGMLERKMARDDPLRTHVTHILTAADRAANLTRSLLAFGRAAPVAMKQADLNEIVTGMEKMLRRLIREDIELRLNLAQGLLTLSADVGQIEQVLMNLATNAQDAMPSGGTIFITTNTVTIDEEFRRAHGYGAPGSYALLSCADTGMGMEESVRQRIFEPFFTTKEVGRGTGLGLSICYGIIKHHDGYINCYSVPGMGTTFRIYLPLLQFDAGRAEEREAVPVSGGTETILVAEDDPEVREYTTSILTEYGYTVIEAANGDEAVAKFVKNQQRIRLCLFDIVMPKKNGLEAFKEILQILPDMKAIFMSGYQPDISLKKDMQDEISDYVAKPALPWELLRKVREVLDR
jgi:PAS domain S-box-containing protein